MKTKVVGEIVLFFEIKMDKIYFLFIYLYLMSLILSFDRQKSDTYQGIGLFGIIQRFNK